MGRARRLTDRRPTISPARSVAWRSVRCRVHAHDISIGGVGRSEPLEDGDERVQRMRQDVDDLLRKRPGAALGAGSRRPEREMAVDLDERAERRARASSAVSKARSRSS